MGTMELLFQSEACSTDGFAITVSRRHELLRMSPRSREGRKTDSSKRFVIIVAFAFFVDKP